MRQNSLMVCSDYILDGYTILKYIWKGKEHNHDYSIYPGLTFTKY